MLRTLHYFLAGIAIMALTRCAEQTCSAQDLPSAPVPVVPANPGDEGSVRQSQPWTPPGGNVPGSRTLLPPPPIVPPPYAPYQDNNAPLLVRDPLFDRLNSPLPGWFGALELDLVGAHIKNHLQAQLQLDGFDPNVVHLPTAELQWTGGSRIETGYRFCDGWGEILARYRFLVTDGSRVVSGFDLDGSDGVLKSRLSLNAFDLDYGSCHYNLDPHWDLQWRIGARLAAVFFDSRAEAFFLEQRTSNNFVGAGPHSSLELWRSFDWPGLGIFARVDGALLLGQVSQGFEEVVTDENGNATGTAAHITSTQAVPVVEAQLGLGWTSCWHHHWSRLAIGYEFERWWDIGNAADSRAELTAQGVFFRYEFGF
jgi:hypothetical protein